LKYLNDDDTMTEFLHKRYPTIVHIFQCLQEERELLSILLRTRGFFTFQDRVKNVLIFMFRNHSPSKVTEHQFSYPLDFLALFGSATFISVIQYWLQSDMKQTPEQLAQIITDIIFKRPIEAFWVLPSNK